MEDGSLLRGEVLARWQEFVGTGEFFRQVESTVSRVARQGRQRPSRAGPPPAERTRARRCRPASRPCCCRTPRAPAPSRYAAWRRLPGGGPILARHPELAKPAPGLRPDVERLVRDWQGEVFDLVRTEGQGRRTNARIAAYGLNAIGLFLMLVAFGSTGGLVGAEIGIAGGTAVLAQRVLEAIFGDQAVREMAAKARTRLLELTDALYERRATPVCRGTGRRRRAGGPGAASRGRRGRAPGGGAVSPLRMGSSRGAVVSPEQLAAAAASLGAGVDAGGEQLPAVERDRARAVVAKVEERTALVGGHTVVALAGATGSGKSSLFNALVGSPVATVGVRRPTTSTPVAAIWGDEPVGELLDWVGVGARHHVEAPQDGGPARVARRTRAAGPPRLRLPRGGPPGGGRAGARARRPLRLGHRPTEVRRLPAARRLRRGPGDPRSGDDGRPQPDRPVDTRRGRAVPGGPRATHGARRRPAGNRARHLGDHGGQR